LIFPLSICVARMRQCGYRSSASLRVSPKLPCVLFGVPLPAWANPVLTQPAAAPGKASLRQRVPPAEGNRVAGKRQREYPGMNPALHRRRQSIRKEAEDVPEFRHHLEHRLSPYPTSGTGRVRPALPRQCIGQTGSSRIHEGPDHQRAPGPNSSDIVGVTETPKAKIRRRLFVGTALDANVVVHSRSLMLGVSIRFASLSNVSEGNPSPIRYDALSSWMPVALSATIHRPSNFA